METKWEEMECSHYIPVAELFGFLNLDRYPYYNGVSGETYAGFVKSPDASAYDRCEAVGALTAPFLSEQPEAERELGRLVVAKAREWTDRQAAAALLHLAIDAFIYLAQGEPSLGISTAETVAETPAPYDAPPAKPVPAPALPGTAPLPEVLRAVADEALGFLKDGHHVLLAGSGTGRGGRPLAVHERD